MTVLDLILLLWLALLSLFTGIALSFLATYLERRFPGKGPQ